MNKQTFPDMDENKGKEDKLFSEKNINEEQVSHNPSKQNTQPLAEGDQKAKVIPMHEEDTLGNP